MVDLGGDGLGHRVAAVGGHALGEVLAGRGGECLHFCLVAGLGLVLGDGALGARLLGLHGRGGGRVGLLRRLKRLEALQRGLELGELGGLRVELLLGLAGLHLLVLDAHGGEHLGLVLEFH